MTQFIYANQEANGMVSVSDRGNGEKAVVKATRIQKGKWNRHNNRRTDIWFTWNGVNYWGWNDETRTVFKAKALKK